MKVLGQNSWHVIFWGQNKKVNSTGNDKSLMNPTLWYRQSSINAYQSPDSSETQPMQTSQVTVGHMQRKSQLILCKATV